jgi:dUTP pyrophosphatase
MKELNAEDLGLPVVKKAKSPKTTKVQVVRLDQAVLPLKQTPGSAGYDVCANNKMTIWIPAGETRLIPTGLKVALPEGYELQVRSRSGLALKKSVVVLNAPGTVDSDYRQEVGIILVNHGTQSFEVNKGDRIAQFVFAKYETVEFEETDTLDDTERKGGFGSTGK